MNYTNIIYNYSTRAITNLPKIHGKICWHDQYLINYAATKMFAFHTAKEYLFSSNE